MLQYLIDENVNPIYPSQLRYRQPELTVRVVGEPNILPYGTLDPEILCWCEEYDFVLVTNNRRSMPVHLAEHLKQGRHIPGIFILSPRLSIGDNIEDLIFIAAASFENEHQDQIVHLPVTR